MAKLIHTAVKKQLEHYNAPSGWSSVSLPVYESCFDEYGFGDWSFIGATGPTSFTSSKTGASASITLLDVGTGTNALQRADIFIANPGCTPGEYTLDITGIIETYNYGYDKLSVSVNDELIDLEGTILTHANGSDSYVYSNGSFEITSQFDDQDSSDPGSSVYVPTRNITAEGPCFTQITFWSSTGDAQHNTTSLGNVKYDIVITKI